MNDLYFFSAGSIHQLTGGYLYNARVMETLSRHDINVRVIEVDGAFPEGDETARASLEHHLNELPDGARAVMDGLCIGNFPELIEAHQNRLTITAIVHLPLADETGLTEAMRVHYKHQEIRTLAAVDDVIVTSRFMVERLANYNVSPDAIHVVEPGVDRFPLGQPDRHPPRLLCVATVTPRKGQALLVDALADLKHLEWECDLVGALDRAPEYVEDVRARIAAHGLEDRVHLLGERQGDALAQYYKRAYLFVLPSYFESYGMVINEAIAFGVPVVTMKGGALMDTLPKDAGIVLPTGDTEALKTTLGRLIEVPAERQKLTQGALTAREHLRRWTDTGYRFMKALHLAQTA
ncbi:glycosyltransferase family 4 protein [Larsenimonas salina]|uniref:glycosyltransferase family 4 protein n=1 Tax=Larsenimonas salina TaxID=1295565 RepID=UPI002073E297|nr:glycosyltransferase family 4 protein [Larsenimonas salina]MCM5703806.1 glycosyltransferase family 4 protein [Larsenimonas salina]